MSEFQIFVMLYALVTGEGIAPENVQPLIEACEEKADSAAAEGKRPLAVLYDQLAVYVWRVRGEGRHD